MFARIQLDSGAPQARPRTRHPASNTCSSLSGCFFCKALPNISRLLHLPPSAARTSFPTFDQHRLLHQLLLNKSMSDDNNQNDSAFGATDGDDDDEYLAQGDNGDIDANGIAGGDDTDGGGGQQVDPVTDVATSEEPAVADVVLLSSHVSEAVIDRARFASGRGQKPTADALDAMKARISANAPYMTARFAPLVPTSAGPAGAKAVAAANAQKAEATKLLPAVLAPIASATKITSGIKFDKELTAAELDLTPTYTKVKLTPKAVSRFFSNVVLTRNVESARQLFGAVILWPGVAPQDSTAAPFQIGASMGNPDEPDSVDPWPISAHVKIDRLALVMRPAVAKIAASANMAKTTQEDKMRFACVRQVQMTLAALLQRLNEQASALHEIGQDSTATKQRKNSALEAVVEINNVITDINANGLSRAHAMLGPSSEVLAASNESVMLTLWEYAVISDAALSTVYGSTTDSIFAHASKHENKVSFEVRLDVNKFQADGFVTDDIQGLLIKATGVPIMIPQLYARCGTTSVVKSPVVAAAIAQVNARTGGNSIVVPAPTSVKALPKDTAKQIKAAAPPPPSTKAPETPAPPAKAAAAPTSAKVAAPTPTKAAAPAKTAAPTPAKVATGKKSVAATVAAAVGVIDTDAQVDALIQQCQTSTVPAEFASEPAGAKKTPKKKGAAATAATPTAADGGDDGGDENKNDPDEPPPPPAQVADADDDVDDKKAAAADQEVVASPKVPTQNKKRAAPASSSAAASVDAPKSPAAKRAKPATAAVAPVAVANGGVVASAAAPPPMPLATKAPFSIVTHQANWTKAPGKTAKAQYARWLRAMRIKPPTKRTAPEEFQTYTTTNQVLANPETKKTMLDIFLAATEMADSLGFGNEWDWFIADAADVDEAKAAAAPPLEDNGIED